MTVHNQAIAELAETVGGALLRFAEQVRSPGQAPSPPAPLPVPRLALGASQTLVYEALGAEAGVSGMTAKEVADVTGLQPTNTPSILARLVARGLVTLVGDRPKVWARVEPGEDR